MTLKAYSVYDRNAGPQEGAALAFAPTAKMARKLGFPTIHDWFGSEWIDVAADRLHGDEAWLAAQEGVDLNGRPRVIESPKVCDRCDIWGSGLLGANGVCEDCVEEEPGE